jgi:hypothetical protein
MKQGFELISSQPSSKSVLTASGPPTTLNCGVDGTRGALLLVVLDLVIIKSSFLECSLPHADRAGDSKLLSLCECGRDHCCIMHSLLLPFCAHIFCHWSQISECTALGQNVLPLMACLCALVENAEILQLFKRHRHLIIIL